MSSRVIDYLLGRGVRFTVIPRQDEAAPTADLARTLVAITGFGPELLVVPAEREIDEERMREAVGDADARLATPREIETTFLDYEPDTLPPLSLLLVAPMYVDPAIADASEITFLAGRRDVSVRMSTEDLFGNDPVVIAPLVAETRLTEPAA
jgi:prolyl-tRNA editing enzyme YbaK/EbsC (Cys-tRNA(Pro) deacylase)